MRHGACTRRKLQAGIVVMAVVFAFVTTFCLVHCGHDTGMSPEFCAKMLGTPQLFLLTGLLVMGWFALHPSPALVPIRPARFYRPPRDPRS